MHALSVYRTKRAQMHRDMLIKLVRRTAVFFIKALSRKAPPRRSKDFSMSLRH
jgi:hypothetical protein